MPTAVDSDHVTVYVGDVPLTQHRGIVPAGALVNELHECTLVADVANTMTVTDTYDSLVHATIMFKTSNASDMFTEPPYFSLSGTTLTLTFKTNAPEAEGATIRAWFRTN